MKVRDLKRILAGYPDDHDIRKPDGGAWCDVNSWAEWHYTLGNGTIAPAVVLGRNIQHEHLNGPVCIGTIKCEDADVPGGIQEYFAEGAKVDQTEEEILRLISGLDAYVERSHNDVFRCRLTSYNAIVHPLRADIMLALIEKGELISQGHGMYYARERADWVTMARECAASSIARLYRGNGSRTEREAADKEPG